MSVGGAGAADSLSSSTSQYSIRSSRMSCTPARREYSCACKRCRQLSLREPRPWPRASIGPASTARSPTSASSDSLCHASTRAWTTRTIACLPTGSRRDTTSRALAHKAGLGRAGVGSTTTPSGLRGEASGENSAEATSVTGGATLAPPHAIATAEAKPNQLEVFHAGVHITRHRNDRTVGYHLPAGVRYGDVKVARGQTEMHSRELGNLAA